MKRIATRFLFVLFMVSALTSPVLAASLPETEPTPATAKSEPDPASVKNALKEFRSLPRKERKARIKEAKKHFKEYRAEKRAGAHKDDTDMVLLVILAVILPPLAVYLKEGEINSKFWLSLILTLIFWIPGVVYAFLVIFDEA